MDDQLFNVVRDQLNRIEEKFDRLTQGLASAETVKKLEGRIDELEKFKGKLVLGIAALSITGGASGHMLVKLAEVLAK